MLLGDAHVEELRREALCEDVHTAALGHSGSDAHHLVVSLRKLTEHLAEDVLVAVGLAGRFAQFSALGVEAARGVPGHGVGLGCRIALALDGDTVEYSRSAEVLDFPQGLDQGLYVIAVDGAEVSEIQRFEDVSAAFLYKPGLETLHPPLDGVAQVSVAQEFPHLGLDAVVSSAGCEPEQMLVQSAHVALDGLVVVIEDDQQVGIRDAGVVQPLEGEASGHRAVADDGGNLLVRAGNPCAFGYAQRSGNRGGRVACAETVIFALAPFGEAADSALLPEGRESLAAPGEYLVGIGLVAYIKDQFVLRRVINIVEGHNLLHRAEA